MHGFGVFCVGVRRCALGKSLGYVVTGFQMGGIFHHKEAQH